MIKFFLGEFQRRWVDIEEVAKNYEAAACGENGGDQLKPEDFQRLGPIVQHFWFICKSLELKNASQQTFQFENSITDEACNYQSVNAMLKNLIITTVMEINNRTLAFIQPEKVAFFERDGDEALFDEGVYQHFKSARAEIKDAGNCLAADLNTAAVFHLMRVVNIGARALARSLEIKSIKGRELEYCRDDSLFNAIEERIDVKLESVKDMARDEKWENENAFYRGLLTDLRYFKDVIRDPIAHARKSYSEHGAMDAYYHVRDFMKRLAGKISE